MVIAPRIPAAGYALALALLSPVPAPGQESQALLEVTAPRTEYFVGQLIDVRMSFGLEQEFLERAAVQPFGAPLDLPVQLHAAWLDGLPGATLVSVGTGEAEADLTASFALNGALRHARRLPDRVVEGRTFRMHAIDARLVATATGALRVPRALLSFAYATRFEDTLLDERAPLDRVDASVLSAPLELSVRALPEAGRPFEFSGVVGDLALVATVDSPEIVLGQSLKLRLELGGDANLALFEAPRWRDLGGFRVLGVLDEPTEPGEQPPHARVLTLDLAPVSEQVWQIPAVSIAYFDPQPPGAYRVVRSEPLEVRVLPAPASASEPLVASAEHGEPGPEPVDPDSGGGLLWVAGAAGLLLLGALMLRRR